MPEILNQSAKNAPYFASNWIYKTTAPDSKLCFAFVDKCAFEVEGTNFAKFAKMGILLPEFVADVFLA